MSAAETDERSIPELFGDALRAVLGILRSTARMFGHELSEATRRAGRGAALLVVSSVVAAAGLMFLIGAAALLAERLLHAPLWAVLAVVGALIAAAGAVGVRIALRRLAETDLTFRGTVAELGKDADALSRPGDRR